jgi:5-methylcytosine-specific restriction endonuclease McrBC regulatory subunit McrC
MSHDRYCCSHSLVQIAERREAHQAAKQQNLPKALHHFTRALSIVEFVRGSSPQEQQEVDNNAAAVLLEMAAVHSAMQVHGRRGGG